jgi:hypothetical protein
MKTKIWTDPIVDEIHKVREKIAREAGYNMDTLVARLQESQKRHGNKLVTLAPKRAPRKKKSN